jgi:hypothetical protein
MAPLSRSFFDNRTSATYAKVIPHKVQRAIENHKNLVALNTGKFSARDFLKEKF